MYNINQVLSSYCINTKFEVTEILPNVPSDEEIQDLTMNNAQYRQALWYDSDWKFMKAGIMKGMSQIFGECKMNLNLYFLNKRFFFSDDR